MSNISVMFSNNKRVELAFVFLFFSFFFFAQKKKKSDQSFIRMEIYKNVAENIYSPSLYKRIGDYYYFKNEMGKSKEWYSKLVDPNRGRLEPEYYYRYSQTLKNLGYYDKADDVYRKFKQTASELFKNEDVGDADFSKYMSEQSGRYIVANEHKINTKYTEFSPNFYLGNLIFSSTRDFVADPTEAFGVSRRGFARNKYDLYVAKLSSKTNRILKYRKMKNVINTVLDETSPVLSFDGNTIYFSRTSCESKSAGGKCVLKIFKSERGEGYSWSKPVELPFNSEQYSCSHPAISMDGNYLYFVSNKDNPKDTYGTDIYVVPIDGGEFLSEPVKVIGINTTNKETTPFIGNNGEIYFASDGHKGLGGMDVFVAKFNTPYDVERVYNVGPDINTKYDEYGMIFDTGSRYGYFVSNRPGGHGQEDIYSFVEIRPLLSDCHINISGIVLDRVTGMPLNGVTVDLIDDKNNILERTRVNDMDGKFQFSSTACNSVYFARAYREEYITSEKLIAESMFVGATNTMIDISLDRENMNIPSSVFASYSGSGVISGDGMGRYNINPVYFRTASSVLSSAAKKSLDSFVETLYANPNLKVEVVGNSDYRGSKLYNLKLSQKRALATFTYLVVTKGIDPNRITIKCLGEENPVNDCKQGIDCTAEELKLNRRSDFNVEEKEEEEKSQNDEEDNVVSSVFE